MEPPKVMLTENIIKKEAMSFLKGYYKYKPRGEGNTIVKFDMRAEGGLIADGYLEFKDLDGETFAATLEATSESKRSEVIYQLQKKLLYWDSGSLAILFSVISLIIFQRFELFSYDELRLSVGLLLSWVLIVFYFLLFRIGLQFLDRYRYIYAIEQFAKYNVDEKWICIGSDVFPSGSDKYFKQLKKRCIAHGVGLLSINHNLQVTPIATAAKSDRGNNDARTRFNHLDAWVNTMSSKVGMKTDLSMQRFAPKFYIQQTIIVFSICFLCVLMVDKYERFRHQSSDAEEIVNEVYDRNSNQIPEPEAYLVNESAMNQFGKQIEYSTVKDDTLMNAYRNWQSSKLEAEKDSLKINKAFDSKIKKGIDSCNKWKGLGKGYFIIIKGIYLSERAALDQQLFVSRDYDGVGILPAYCLDSETAHYYVYVGKPTKDARSAEQLLNRMNHNENHVLKPKEKRFSLISLSIF